MKSLLLFLSLVLMMPAAWAQQMGEAPEMTTLHDATPAVARLEGYERRQRLHANSLVNNVALDNIGPTVMSGRVVDIDANPADPTHFYVAYASGGLWKTTNNGISFESLFDSQAAMTLGDIAVDWERGETIWVGTGENNASRSSYAGTGLYKSTDGGESWQHVGLAETHRTGRIVLHPTDPNTVWVAASGHLYSPNPERGVYKTTDGGQSWTRTLFVDDDTGAIDLVLDPGSPDVLYAALWHRARRAWNFVEGGEGSGIYKSTDGGETWALLTSERSGFPTGEGVGRIGLAISPSNPNILYASLDNQSRQPEEEEEAEEDPALTRDMLRDMTQEAFLALADDILNDFLRDNGFPQQHTAASVKASVESGELQPVALVEFLEDANQQLFDTPVIGPEVYRSDNGGRTWRRTHEDFINQLYFTFGYYFGQVRVAPDDADRIYLLGVPILKSTDGGETFESINESNVHVDHHALWVNPGRPGHLINGNDGGLNISYDDGETWFKANTPSVGQFYAIAVDDAEPYNVYGGLQDNGVWKGPHTYSSSYGWYGSGDYPYDRVLGGDGMQVEVDTRTNDIIYTGFQFGNYWRINTATGDRSRITPRHELGERPLRFNWQAPIHLSRHQQDILYFGSNKLHRSFNGGDDWEAISDDLTHGGQPGDVPYGTLATIDESPLRLGLLYTGSDDGLVHVTGDGGATWARISDGLPQDLWVSRVEASHHRRDRVYVTLNGYRWDNFEAYLYRSDDRGASWERLGLDLPHEPVNVVVEDPSNELILYVGTDHGLYVSIDGGQSFMTMMHEMPNVPVHDLVVQARAQDLLVGTHGRSIYRGDLEQVQQLPELVGTPVHLFALGDVNYNDGWGERSAIWQDYRVPEVEISLFAGQAGTAVIRIKAEDGSLLQERREEVDAGLNYLSYDLSVDANRLRAFNRQRTAEDAEADVLEEADNGVAYLLPGTYTVEIEHGGETVSGNLEVVQRQRRGFNAAPGSEPDEMK